MAIPLAEPLPQKQAAPDTLNGRDARGRRIRGRKPAGRARKSRCQSGQSLRCCTRAGELRSAKGERKKRATEPLFRIPSLLFEDAESWASHPAGNKLHKISSPASSRRPEVSVCLALPPRCLSQVSGSVRTGRGVSRRSHRYPPRRAPPPAPLPCASSHRLLDSEPLAARKNRPRGAGHTSHCARKGRKQVDSLPHPAPACRQPPQAAHSAQSATCPTPWHGHDVGWHQPERMWAEGFAGVSCSSPAQTLAAGSGIRECSLMDTLSRLPRLQHTMPRAAPPPGRRREFKSH